MLEFPKGSFLDDPFSCYINYFSDDFILSIAIYVGYATLQLKNWLRINFNWLLNLSLT